MLGIIKTHRVVCNACGLTGYVPVCDKYGRIRRNRRGVSQVTVCPHCEGKAVWCGNRLIRYPFHFELSQIGAYSCITPSKVFAVLYDTRKQIGRGIFTVPLELCAKTSKDGAGFTRLARGLNRGKLTEEQVFKKRKVKYKFKGFPLLPGEDGWLVFKKGGSSYSNIKLLPCKFCMGEGRVEARVQQNPNRGVYNITCPVCEGKPNKMWSFPYHFMPDMKIPLKLLYYKVYKPPRYSRGSFLFNVTGLSDSTTLVQGIALIPHGDGFRRVVVPIQNLVRTEAEADKKLKSFCRTRQERSSGK